LRLYSASALFDPVRVGLGSYAKEFSCSNFYVELERFLIRAAALPAPIDNAVTWGSRQRG
jgi:hypothetical protein